MIMPRLLLSIAIASVPLVWSFSWLAPHTDAPAASRGSSGCPAAEARQFDFWIGDWELERSDGARARVRVTSTLEGCVIQEDFDAAPGSPLVGRSLASWDVQSRGWKQTWVDDHGSFFSFAGGFADGRMTLTAPSLAADKASLHRRVWSAITPDSFEWSWETSDDDGRTWRPAWTFMARRALASSASSALSPFTWLEGRWDGTLPNGMKADITYMDARAGAIAGTMRLHNARGDTLVMGEIILLSATADGVTMRAHHFTRELRIREDTAMTLRYTGGRADSLHFVSVIGPKMDVAYLRRGPDEHVARSVIHHPDGRDQIIEVQYRRRR